MKRTALGATLGIVAFAALTFAAHAEDKPAGQPSSWWDTFSISGHVEGGITYNTYPQNNGLNFGQLFTDKTNTPLLNQALVTVQRPTDPKATGYDFGFKFQAMYGTDARYTHFLGQFDEWINDIGQLDIVEANVQVHLPWLTPGGIDVKIGEYVTLEGAELISAPDNPLYSHSYIFNFGIPFKHTGVLTTTHVNDWLDIYAGFDSGVNTTFGCCGLDTGDNNLGVAFHGGFGFNLLDGALTILATTHIGAENPNSPAVQAACNCDPNTALRYLNDITATWKVNDKLTLMADLNYIRDDAFKADGYGAALYGMYQINDLFKIVGRAEIWRDNSGFFVAAYPGNLDFVKVEHGDPTGMIIAGTPTTYGEFTLGLNITPPMPANPVVKALIFRPEIRFDTSLNGTTPYAGGNNSSQFTIASDIIIKF
jgi:Putative beta-barrel porin-2, OmpL-like. bbp2